MKSKKFAALKWHNRFTYLKNIVFDAHDLHQKGTKFQIVRFAAGSAIKPHAHRRTVEIFYILSGTGVLEIAGKKFTIVSGDIFLCEPGDAHAFINVGTAELVVLVFKTHEQAGDIKWKK